MRPTITTPEASYIAEMLKAEIERLEELADREQQLKKEIAQLKRDFIQYRDPSIIYVPLPKKQKQLAEIRRQLSKRPLSSSILKGLFVKYEGLATGKLSKGGRPREAVTFSLLMLERFP